MALIVIEDAAESNAGTTKKVFSDINDLSEESLAKAVLLMSFMQVNKTNIAEVVSDFEEGGGPVLTDDKTAATWHDSVQTRSHFTFVLI